MGSDIRIVMVANYPRPGADAVGGTQVAAERLVTALARRRVEVLIVAPAPGDSTERHIDIDNGVTLVSVPADDRFSLLKGLRSLRRSVRILVERLGADLVHAQGLIAGVAATDIRSLPRVVTAHGNMRADTLAAYGRLRGAPRVHLGARLARIAVERADVVIGVNPDPTINVPRLPRRFVYIPNIIDECFYRIRRQREPNLVLFAGGHYAIKGWPLLAAAWPEVQRAVPDAHLLTVGWPRHALPELSGIHKDSVTAEGWLSTDELAARMGRAAALVIPSKFEVSPILLAEAWAAGVPVVVTSVGGLRAVGEGAAVIVPRREPRALAAGVVRALAGGDEVQGFIQEGRRRSESHRADAVAEAHMTLYEELVHGSDRA
jgi:glycosyltransferase involved in cell wall biosynthesis